ncbi:MAG TPA: hypothetical protein VGW38_09155, partial [Chloroflexota bacterium]|nr:hypothetical protein [Chloroflexota bacterium]
MKICRQRISRLAAQSAVLVAGLIWALLPITPAWSQSEPTSLAESEQVVSYLRTYEVLAQLLNERYVLEGTVSSASAAERSALDRLASAEERLARLLAEREQRSALEWSVQALIAEAETTLPAIDALHEVAGRRIESQEAWLFGTANVKTPSMRGYLRTLEVGEELDRERRQVEEGVAQAQKELAAAALDLGRLNTEVAFHERQADALSREVGATRARALRASARLGGVEEQARVLVGQLHAQLDVLKQGGHPIGVAVASSGPPPVPDPLQWPQSPPRRYVLPFGASAAALRHGEPLRLLPQQIRDLGVFETGWQAPV